jgi:uncharacterized protein (TIGR00725 family)
MGSGTISHAARAEPLGAWLAGEGVHLLTGGGSGVMTAVSRAFTRVAGRRGLCIGVLPAAAADPAAGGPAGYPNPWVELVIRTHLPYSGAYGTGPLSRNHINILSADAIIALPGAAGTSSEVHLALRYQRPLIAYLSRPDEIPDLPPQTPVARELAEVQAFVRQALSVPRDSA